MGRNHYGRQNATVLAKGRPLINLLLLSGLAGCSALGGGQTAQLGTGSGMGPSTGVMNVADAAIAGGDPQMALKVSQSVLANDPKNLDALYHEGQAYYAINRCMDAIAVYKVALTVDPKSSPAQLGIGRCLLKVNAAQAEAAFAAAVADDPGNAAALNDLGIARDLQGNHAGAVQPYQQALLIDPGNLGTEVNIGMSLALSGNGQEALQYLGPLATSPQATPKIREDYAAALVAANRQDEAKQVLSIDLPPDQIGPLINDFAAAISVGQLAASTPPAPATESSASVSAASVAAQAATPMVVSTPVVQTALVTPPSPPPPVVTEAASAPPVKTMPPASAPPAPIKTAAADPAPVTADPPAPALVATQPAVTQPVDTPPADTSPPATPAPAADPAPAMVPAAAPPPAPAPPPPAKPKSSGSWWSLLRAPTSAPQ
jgi:Flp pilus assembly protein TadD